MTLFTSATKKYLFTYLGLAAFCFVFQGIYGIFSHGVSSAYMTFAFLIPLVGGIVCSLSYKNYCRQCINGAVAWLTLGSIYKGVLEIYGTTNRKVIVFAIVGGLHLMAALICGIAGRRES